MWVRQAILVKIVITIVEGLHKNLESLTVVSNNLKIILSTRISKSNKSKTSMLDSNMLRINLCKELLKTNRKGIIIKFVTACSLPREILHNNRDKLLLDSNMFSNKLNNSQALLKHLDSHYPKLIL